jgi:hypothetical protein
MFLELKEKPWFRSNAGMNPAGYRKLFESVAKPILNAAGVPLVPYTQYLWYTSELARVFRKFCGGSLHEQLDQVVRKWGSYGLDSVLLQRIMCACYRELKTRAVQLEEVHRRTERKVKDGETSK